MNIGKALTKEFEGKPLKDIVDAPVQALQGVSDADAKHLGDAFSVRTVRQLADLKY